MRDGSDAGGETVEGEAEGSGEGGQVEGFGEGGEPEGGEEDADALGDDAGDEDPKGCALEVVEVRRSEGAACWEWEAAFDEEEAGCGEEGLLCE